jgi:hypothetical protein
VTSGDGAQLAPGGSGGSSGGGGDVGGAAGSAPAPINPFEPFSGQRFDNSSSVPEPPDVTGDIAEMRTPMNGYQIGTNPYSACQIGPSVSWLDSVM